MKWTAETLQSIVEDALAYGVCRYACESDRAAALLRRAIYRRKLASRWPISVSVDGDVIIVRALGSPVRIT